MLISLIRIWYPIGSSILSTHQLGGFAGPESRASLQTFPGAFPELDITTCSFRRFENICVEIWKLTKNAAWEA